MKDLSTGHWREYNHTTYMYTRLVSHDVGGSNYHSRQTCKYTYQQGNQRWQIPGPATCQCLATNILIFFVTSFLCSLEFLYRELIGLSKRFPWQIFEINCLSSLWDLRHWIVRLYVYWRGMTSLTYVTFVSGVYWPTGSMYAQVCND